jgi:hypothetical protein
MIVIFIHMMSCAVVVLFAGALGQHRNQTIGRFDGLFGFWSLRRLQLILSSHDWRKSDFGKVWFGRD